MLRYLLDTNICIYVLRHRPQEVREAFNRHAAHLGSIRAELERKREPIGACGLMIAGHARSAGLRLVTNNEREFNRVSGLLVENWT